MRYSRKVKKNAIYHAYARANLQEHILALEENKKMMEETFERAHVKFKFRLIHFCIMGNHIHLLIKPIGEPEMISKIMQWILSVFAIKFNKKYHLKGHVWYDRFKSRIVETIEYLKVVFEYISNNPVKAKLVDVASDYKYSGLFHLLHGDYHLVEKPSKLLLKLISCLRI
ncbi:MAG: transposase [Bacteroidetes bacterium]|nr:transposase [Bacteroidota bacterium]